MLSNDKLFDSRPKLLMTEDPAEYKALWTQLFEEQKPVGVIERFYVDDAARLLWEINRLRDCKTDTINRSFKSAVRHLLLQLLGPGSIKVETLSEAWLTDAAAKQDVSILLAQRSLNESSIQSEAINVSSEQLERLDKMLALARSRFDKTVRLSAEYNASFAERLRRNAKNVLQSGDEIEPDLKETFN